MELLEKELLVRDMHWENLFKEILMLKIKLEDILQVEKVLYREDKDINLILQRQVVKMLLKLG